MNSLGTVLSETVTVVSFSTNQR